MKNLILLFCCVCLSVHSFAQQGEITKKKIHGGKFNSQDTTAGYAEAVLVDNILYVSGSISKGTIAEQLQGIYTDLGNTLKAYGASYKNVVKETLFTTGSNYKVVLRQT